MEPNDILAALRNQSFVILRNILPADVRDVLRMAQLHVDELVMSYVRRPDDENPIAENKAFDPKKMNMIFEKVMDRRNENLYFEIIESITIPILEKLSDGFHRTAYGGMFLSDPRLSRGRNFYWHPDGHFDGLTSVGVNFWIPMRACGEVAPGIMLAEASEERLITGLSLLPQSPDPNPNFHTKVEWTAASDDDILKSIGPLVAPQFELGDVLVFTDRCVHRTNMTSLCVDGRGAIIIRYRYLNKATISDMSCL